MTVKKTQKYGGAKTMAKKTQKSGNFKNSSKKDAKKAENRKNSGKNNSRKGVKKAGGFRVSLTRHLYIQMRILPYPKGKGLFVKSPQKHLK